MNTEFKGSLGEWYIVASEPIEIATDKKSICMVSIQDYFNKDIEARHNAQLIATSPLLLEACIKLQEWHKKYPTGKIYNHSTSLVLERELTEVVELQVKAIQKALNP